MNKSCINENCCSGKVLRKFSIKKISLLTALWLSAVFAVFSQPANDTCASAIPILCGQTLNGSTVNATADAVIFCETEATAPGVWYSFTGTGALVTVTLCGS